VSLSTFLPYLTHFRLRAHRWMVGILRVDLSSRQRSAACPSCQHGSRAVRSSYRCAVADLPLAGARLFLPLQVRRYFCGHAPCPRRIFAEQFPTLVPVRGRHGLGVCSALRHVAIAGSHLLHPCPRICGGGGTPAVGPPNSSGGSSWPRGTSRRAGRGAVRRPAAARDRHRLTCRQATPAPLHAEDHDESRPAP
jgi:hypothetical protein